VVASRFGRPEIQSTLKFVYERKRAGKKEERRNARGKREHGAEGEERKLSEGDDRCTGEGRKGRRAGAAPKMRTDHFSGTGMSCPTTIMRTRHNGDRDRSVRHCAHRSAPAKSSHFCVPLDLPGIPPCLREVYSPTLCAPVLSINETSRPRKVGSR